MDKSGSEMGRRLRVGVGAVLVALVATAGTALALAPTLHVKVSRSVRIGHELFFTVAGRPEQRHADLVAISIFAAPCPEVTHLILRLVPNLPSRAFRQTVPVTAPTRPGRYHLCAYLERSPAGVPTVARASTTITVTR